MTKKLSYAVIGAGRQGTAAAYDLAKWGNAEQIVLADYDFFTFAFASISHPHQMGWPQTSRVNTRFLQYQCRDVEHDD